MSKGIKIIFAIFLIAGILALRWSPVGSLLTFENLVQHRDGMLAYVQAHYAMSVFLFIVLYIVVTAFSVPGAVILTLAGGFLFRTVAATVYVDIGATTGAVLAFLSARFLLGQRLQEKYARQLEAFNAEIRSNGKNYLLTVRFIPVFPFFLINFLAGLTSVPLSTFAWTTAVGIIPGTMVFAFAGRQIATLSSLSGILSRNVLLALSALALFSLIPVFIKKWKQADRQR
ncbi:MAG TPA: TVP38/TMEM64 family protein [Nitrospirota bacterium]|nr:TVP38/TMEM64 family protein [Nitrospirota bacterium]